MKLRMSGNQTPDARRAELEGRYTQWRIIELEANPVEGRFDAAHLKEVNRRIFQDLPGAGFDDVTPGEFRPAVPDGVDWIKHRGLSTVDGSFFVAYSRMDDAAKARLDKVLAAADPEKLRGLKTPEFTAQLAKIYTELDYIHPFSDGNSRTLRTFTKQLARSAGYALDWERFGNIDVGRDLLYVARDLSVNALAMPNVQNESTMQRILYTTDRLQGNRTLPDLLRDAVRPTRAVAFEQMPEYEALKAHPELGKAYRTLHTLTAYFESKMPGQPKAQAASIETVVKRIQKHLNAGEIADFGRNGEANQKQRQTPHREQTDQDQERER